MGRPNLAQITRNVPEKKLHKFHYSVEVSFDLILTTSIHFLVAFVPKLNHKMSWLFNA